MNHCLSLTFVLLSAFNPIFAQTIDSKTYAWKEAAVTKKANSEQRVILDGSTTDFSLFKLHATTVPAHQAPHPAHKHDDEELIIIKEGELTVTIAGKTKTLGAGSVALMMPGDEHGFENKSDDKDSEESVGGKLFQATVGDVIYLESNVPHALHNTSKGSCTYFAFQFE